MAVFVVPFVLVLLALALLVAEDLLPTAGMLGILAACSLLFLLYLGFSQSVAMGSLYLAFEFVCVPAGFAAWSILLANTKLGRVARLLPPEAHEIDVSTEGPDLGRLVGLRGRAVTPLRPSGMVDFEGRRLDGVAEEGLIPSGSLIEVVEVRSGRLIVRASVERLEPGVE
jgi:membrane-bound serine protease (ClpP class)